MSDDQFHEVTGCVIGRWCDLDADSQGVLVATVLVTLVWLVGVDIRW